jgi:Domain of unknown function (DUF5666)
MTMFGTLTRWRGPTFALLSLVLLVSCGGSGVVDTGGTGVAQSLAAGPVTGLGSVFVSDVRFDDSTSTITDEDDNVLTQDQLQVGMLTRVDASTISDTDNEPMAVALSVRVFSEVKGPVDSINVAGNTMVVLGQTVRITAATWFDSALSGGLSAISVGQVLEVYGQYNARTDQYFATRIVPRTSPSEYVVRGLLSSVSPATSTLTINALTVSYSALSAASLPPLNAGAFLRIKVAVQPNSNVWTATAVTQGGNSLPDRKDVRVVGRISAWTSSSQFSVNGIPVDASTASFPAGASGVVLGARVGVLGSASGGVLKASTVIVKGDESAANSTFEFHGAVSSLNTINQTLSVRGITVNYSAQTQFIGGAITDLAVGRNIDVIGPLSTDLTGIQAQSITFD